MILIIGDSMLGVCIHEGREFGKSHVTLWGTLAPYLTVLLPFDLLGCRASG